jgi:hypothetical protein
VEITLELNPRLGFLEALEKTIAMSQNLLGV